MPKQNPATIARRGSRRELLLDVAAHLFCKRGFAGTSIRDIAKAVKMLPGSIYCHFDSKEALFLAVYGEGVRRIAEQVGAVIGTDADPWQRLRLACAAHMETILDQSDFAQVVVRVHPREVPNMSSRLIALRDDYETVFKDLIAMIEEIPPEQKRSFRLLLMGAMNWTQHWYQPAGESPAQIADQFLSLLRVKSETRERHAHVQ